jgi:glycosyltransferase involved in cell wall biosynthesis
MVVSFIIPHKGREALLERTIQSVIELEFDLKEIEIIVVTQNKELECSNIDLRIVHFTTIFRPEDETISALRNVGVQNASGDYLVFLDADIQLSRNWLKTMFTELNVNDERVLISAVQRHAPDAGRLEKIRTLLNNIAADSSVEFLDGRNLFMRRKTFEKIGDFPEHLVTCEDYYFTNNAHQLGKLYCTSKAFYIHLGEDKNYGEMFRKELWRGQSNLQSIRGRKISLREIPSLLIPVWEIVFLFGTLIFIEWGKIVPGILSLLMLCFPIMLYAIRLYRIGKNRISFVDSVGFYCVYFPARVIGTTIGIFKTIKQ